MRISERERNILIRAVVNIDPEAKVWLFGSRVQDDKRGGDIDMAILSKNIGRKEIRTIKRNITDLLGEQHIDIIASRDGRDPFFKLSVERGEILYA